MEVLDGMKEIGWHFHLKIILIIWLQTVSKLLEGSVKLYTNMSFSVNLFITLLIETNLRFIN